MSTKQLMGITQNINIIPSLPISSTLTTSDLQAMNNVKLMLNGINMVKRQVDGMKGGQITIYKLMDTIGGTNLAGMIPDKNMVLSKMGAIKKDIDGNINMMSNVLGIKENNPCFNSSLQMLKNINNDVFKFVTGMINKVFDMVPFPQIINMIYSSINYILGLVRKTGIDKVINQLWNLLNMGTCIVDQTFLDTSKATLRSMAIGIGFKESFTGGDRFIIKEDDIRNQMKIDMTNMFPSFDTEDFSSAFDLVGEMNKVTSNIVDEVENNTNSLLDKIKKTTSQPMIPSSFI